MVVRCIEDESSEEESMRKIVTVSVLLSVALALGCQTAPPKGKKRSRPRPAVQTVELRHVVVPAKQQVAGPAVETAAVGRVAPDFTLPAYSKGKFTKETLSKHRGKWVVLCFYPGDFTFV